MNKTVVVLASMLALLLNGCGMLPALTPGAGTVVDTAGTATAQFNTAVAQSLTAQPPSQPVSATDTPVVLAEAPATNTALPTFTPFATFTSVPNLTTTPVTATSGSAVATNVPASATLPVTLLPGQVTASPTLGIRKYGTQPPEVTFSHITLINKAKAEAYISLQVTMPDGKFSILEYPVAGRIKIESPVGSYLYVAWVGGRKMVGTFKLTHGDDLEITLYKNKVTIK